MKKFFSMDGKFTIFTLVGIIVILSNFFIPRPYLPLMGILIAWIPLIKYSIVTYKTTGKIVLPLITSVVIIVCLIIIFILEVLNI